ncbi:MAG: hypothetical protein ABWZ78_12645 [Burkholderiaceae bacterium]
MTDRGRVCYDRVVDDYAARIRKAGGRVALYLTRAYVKPHKAASTEMGRRTADMVLGAGNRVGALVLPVGLAFEAYRQRPDLALHQSYDGSHPSLAGSSLAAASSMPRSMAGLPSATATTTTTESTARPRPFSSKSQPMS